MQHPSEADQTDRTGEQFQAACSRREQRHRNEETGDQGARRRRHCEGEDIQGVRTASVLQYQRSAEENWTAHC